MLEPGPPVMRYLAKLLAGPIIQAQPKKQSQCLSIGRTSLFAVTNLILYSTVSCFCLFPYSYKTLLFYSMILILFVPRLPIFSVIFPFV